MTCEDTPSRITWEVQLYEPVSHVWMCEAYGRATTTAAPADIARAALAGHLTQHPARTTDTYRATVRTDDGQTATVHAGDLDAEWTAGPDVLEALPIYLRPVGQWAPQAESFAGEVELQQKQTDWDHQGGQEQLSIL